MWTLGQAPIVDPSKLLVDKDINITKNLSYIGKGEKPSKTNTPMPICFSPLMFTFQPHPLMENAAFEANDLQAGDAMALLPWPSFICQSPFLVGNVGDITCQEISVLSVNWQKNESLSDAQYVSFLLVKCQNLSAEARSQSYNHTPTLCTPAIWCTPHSIFFLPYQQY